MSAFNLLFLSAGRRVELVQCFRKAARTMGIESILVGGDHQALAPALYFVDQAVILPKITDPGYIDAIIDTCNRFGITLVIPTIDTDLLILSQNKSKIKSTTGAKVLISSEEVIRICRDKIQTHLFLEQNGFLVPHLYRQDELVNENLRFPLFIKPRDGSSSINAFKAESWQKLQYYLYLIPNPIVQDFVEGEEYTVDAFLDFDGNIISIVPRLRMATRGGEISKGKIVKDHEIIAVVKELLNTLKPIGHITIQCIKSLKGIEFIEINPRFGGGAPMSIKSGADSCKGLYRLLRGEKLEYHEDYQDGLIFLRFDDSICLNERIEIVNLPGDANDY